jgi:hypothetical protein
VFSGFLLGRCTLFCAPVSVASEWQKCYTIYGNCGDMTSVCRLGQLDASGWLFTYKKKRTKPRRAPSVYTFVFLLIIAL